MDKLSYQPNSQQSGLYSVHTQNTDEGGNALACSNHATSSQGLPDQERLIGCLDSPSGGYEHYQTKRAYQSAYDSRKLQGRAVNCVGSLALDRADVCLSRQLGEARSRLTVPLDGGRRGRHGPKQAKIPRNKKQRE